jgi:acetyltransferase-like isoleucine patch superfamily enzyme
MQVRISIKEGIRLYGVIIALLRGQMLLFPRLNSIRLRIYGRVKIRGAADKIIFGDRVTFLGDATIIAKSSNLDEKIYIGDQVNIEQGVYLNAHGGTIQIGHRVFLGVSSLIQGKGGVVVGNDTMLGPSAQVYSSDHGMELGDKTYQQQNEISSPINIGKNVWIGAGSIILRGTELSDNSIVAAGSIVKAKLSKAALIMTRNGLAEVKSFRE